MKFKTAVSKTEDGKHLIQGYDLLELMEKHSFVEVIFLLWRKTLPSDNEKKLLEAILIAAVENGIESPSVFIPRVVASTGNDFHVALASGMLSIGEKHGGAGEAAAQLFASKKSPKEIVGQESIVPGFGHKVYKEEDPRAAFIYQKAKELGFECHYFGIAYEIEKELEQTKGKKLPLNIDGAIAAAMLELKFDPVFGKAFFLLSRMVGMASHIAEELEQKNSYHRLEESDVEYEE